MARKRSVRGRAKVSTPISRLNISMAKVNRRLRSLERAGMFGQYSFKRLLRRFEDETNISFKRKRRNKFIIKRKTSNVSKLRLYQKNFEAFLKSITSTPIGVKKVRESTREKLKRSLSNITDLDIEDRDLDDFYDLFHDPDFKYLAERIPPSTLYMLIQEAKSQSWSEETFVSQIQMYIQSNNQELRERATRLFNKYIR